MSRRFLFLLLAAGIGTGGAVAGEPPGARRGTADKVVAEQAARLVADLGSDDYDTRAAAARQLEALGRAAAPALQKALVNPDPEVRRLALEVAERLARKSEAAEVLLPKPLRLVYRDVPLHVAVADFARASGAQINLEGVKDSNRKVTLDTGYTSFWDAFDKFCAATGLSEKLFDSPANPNDMGNYQQQMLRRRRMIMWNGMGRVRNQDILPALPNGQFVLTEAKPAPRATFQAGALRFRALPPGTSLGSVSALKGDNELIFGLEIIPEPSLAWERVQCLLIDKAVDDQGQTLRATQAVIDDSLPPSDFDEMVFYGGYDNSPHVNTGQRVPMRLTLGRKPSTLIKELHGVATIKMQTATQTLAAIDDVLNAKNKGAKAPDGSYLKVVEVKREEGGKLDIHVQVDPAPGEDQNMNPWGWGRRRWWPGMNPQQEGVVDNSVSTGHLLLFDARGNLVRLVSKDQVEDPNGTGPEEYHFVYQVAKGQPDPAKLVLQGQKPVTIEVPFTLRDVPLKAAPGAPKPAPPPASRQPQSDVIVDW